jgi:hypothetical protein
MAETVMVSHLSYEVHQSIMTDELEFWRALGFGRITKPEPKWKGEWLRGSNRRGDGSLYIYLMPVQHDPFDHEEWNHVAIIPQYGLNRVLGNLKRMTQVIQAEEAATHWGARRMFVHSPAGYRIELLEHEPLAPWSGPPSDD